MERKIKYDLGVIVGRFQVNDLHEGHVNLINKVLENHKKVAIFLGIKPTVLQKKNPMDFFTRKCMFEPLYKNVSIHSIMDMQSNEEWSKELDNRIREIQPTGTVMLYGSRDSFITSYKGVLPTTELETDTFVSGTDIRDSVSKEVISSSEFRSGVIYATYNKYPIVYSTVDVAIMNNDNTKVLLGKKPKEKEYRFIGGFASPSDNSFEDSAKRESIEECGNIELDEFKYIYSCKIDDWRYRGTEDCIMTHFFICKYIFGTPMPSDDINELKWFLLNELDEEHVVKEHIILVKKLKEYLKK